jgi:hypothetical protein
VLKLCSTEQEAAIYEQFVATHYGIAEWMFRGSAKSLITDEAVSKFFAMLDAEQQARRGACCLIDHGLDPVCPLWSWTGDNQKQSGTRCLETAAANLIPEIMEVPVPMRDGKFEWSPIGSVDRSPYDGPVYSLDVAQHHRYVQDGMVTCNSIKGIGPVIAAGLLANIDITKAPTAGHIWRFAGLDPSSKWVGTAKATELVGRHMGARGAAVSEEVFAAVCEETNTRPESLRLRLTDYDTGEVSMTRAALIKAVAKRPWNAGLKRLCFLIGESFVKVSNRPDDVYGKLYKQRKDWETQKNQLKDYADQAAYSLETKNFGRETEAYKWYSQGMLPPARIHLRAQRRAVKLFLAHLHEVLYWAYYEKLPPNPFVFDHLVGHVHRLEIPNIELVGDLAEAKERAQRGR